MKKSDRGGEYRSPFILDEEEDKLDTQNEVRNIIKSCLIVENEATMIKSKAHGTDPFANTKKKNALF